MWLRSSFICGRLTPVRNPLPKMQVVFPVSRLIFGAPQPVAGPVPRPDVSDPVKRGKFLVSVAACADCHTPHETGQLVAGMDFAGGFVLDGLWGRVASANLTPDPSGIPTAMRPGSSVLSGRVTWADVN
jgi:hypothetical protein